MNGKWWLAVAAILLAVSAAQAAGEGAAPVGKPALLVIDIQKAYLFIIPEHEQKLGLYMVNATIKQFREKGLPVIRVYHQDLEEGPAPGAEGFEFPDFIEVKPEDPKVIKHYPSGFKKTDLDKILKEKGVDTVFLVGLSSVGCVLATYFDARGLDYKTFMVKDAIMSHRPDLTRAVEEITEAVGYEAMKYMLDNAKK